MLLRARRKLRWGYVGITRAYWLMLLSGSVHRFGDAWFLLLFRCFELFLENSTVLRKFFVLSRDSGNALSGLVSLLLQPVCDLEELCVLIFQLLHLFLLLLVFVKIKPQFGILLLQLFFFLTLSLHLGLELLDLLAQQLNFRVHALNLCVSLVGRCVSLVGWLAGSRDVGPGLRVSVLFIRGVVPGVRRRFVLFQLHGNAMRVLAHCLLSILIVRSQTLGKWYHVSILIQCVTLLFRPACVRSIFVH